MKRFWMLLVCLMAFPFWSVVFAQDPQGQPVPRQRGGPAGREKRMKNMDINNDGAVSRDEWKGKPQVFDRFDKNGDGSLTREEQRAEVTRKASPGKQKGHVRQMDANNDQQISREEWKGDAKRFERLDVNSDGVITREEIRSVRRNRQRNQIPNE